MITVTRNYRSVLKEELERRCGRNPRYSLRSFARDLGLSPSALSDVMNGRYGMSRQMAEKITVKIAWSEEEKKLFCDLVESEHARGRKAKDLAKERVHSHIPKYEPLTLDSFAVISDWYHYGLMELIQLKDFKYDLSWISTRLGVSEHVIEPAIERLKRLGIIAEENGKLEVKTNFVSSPSGVPSDAIKSFHRQILEKAITSLDFQTVEERDFSNVVLAVDKNQLPEAKEMIRAFRREFDAKFGKSKNKNEVYNLSVQFFRLTDPSESN